MKKFIKYFALIFLVLFNVKVSALEVNLSDLTSDGASIKEYDNLDDFLVDYNGNNLPSVYITDFLFDGVGAVKTPDLDDLIADNTSKIKDLSIKVLNINTTGDITLSGTVVGMMIGVNTNDVEGNININLNNVNIDTDSKKAPAIYVYNKDITYTKCKVTISTLSGTKNYITGGKLKKVSLVGSDELSNYSKYYSNDTLTNYNTYTSYYGIYTSDEIDNILFAKVTADNEDLQDGDPYYFYKASGAISSDIDLYFNGTGYLEVSSKNKEGIETKGNMTFEGGTGDYVIYAYDDCLNTTTASNRNNSNIRNTITIDVGSMYAVVNEEADEGDAIDSNGELIINGGTIIALAHSRGADSGLDSDGTYINGGTIFANAPSTMMDGIKDTDQKSIYVSLNSTIAADSLVVIKDENDEIIAAFKTPKKLSALLYSSEDLDYESFTIYSGGEIDGVETNGLYTTINSYTNGSEVSYSETSSFGGMNMNFNKGNFNNNKSNNTSGILSILLIELGVLVIVVLGIVFYKKKQS